MLHALSRILSRPSSSVHSSGPIEPAISLCIYTPFFNASNISWLEVDELCTYLVGEEYNGGSRLLNFLVIEQLIKFLLRNTHAQPICTVQNEDDSFYVSIIMFPQVPITALPAHIIDSKIDVVLGKLLDLETNSWGYFKRCCLFAEDISLLGPKIKRREPIEQVTFLGLRW